MIMAVKSRRTGLGAAVSSGGRGRSGWVVRQAGSRARQEDQARCPVRGQRPGSWPAAYLRYCCGRTGLIGWMRENEAVREFCWTAFARREVRHATRNKDSTQLCASFDGVRPGWYGRGRGSFFSFPVCALNIGCFRSRCRWRWLRMQRLCILGRGICPRAAGRRR